MNNLRHFTNENAKWITFVDSEFYPDYLEAAQLLYSDIFTEFKELTNNATSSIQLLKNISKLTDKKRIQLLRIFRKFISPDTSVEMLKKKSKIDEICNEFGNRFREIEEVRDKLNQRGADDEVLFALLYEYKDRGQKGYELTERFFQWFKHKFQDTFTIIGPERAGKDIILSKYLDDYDEGTPADFLISHNNITVSIGFVRYVTDIGGAQEDDRTSGNKDKITLIKNWTLKTGKKLKVIYLNDGPGLLLGSMWEDYCQIEESWPDNVIVVTLKMLESRLTSQWLLN